MKNLSKYVWIITSSLFIICGIICFFNINNVSVIPIIVGCFLLVHGVFQLILYYLLRNQVLINLGKAIEGIFSIIIGIVLLINREQALTFIIVSLGIYILFSGFSKLFHAFMLRRTGGRYYIYALVQGIVLIILSIVCFLSPATTNSIMIGASATYLLIIGISELIEGIEDSLSQKRIENRVSSTSKKSGAIEGEIIDIKDTDDIK